MESRYKQDEACLRRNKKMSKIPRFLPFLGLCIYVGIGMLMSYVTYDSCTKDFYIGSVLLFYAPVALLAYHAAKIKQGKRRCVMIGSVLALGFIYNVTFAAGISGNTTVFLIKASQEVEFKKNVMDICNKESL